MLNAGHVEPRALVQAPVGGEAEDLVRRPGEGRLQPRLGQGRGQPWRGRARAPYGRSLVGADWDVAGLARRGRGASELARATVKRPTVRANARTATATAMRHVVIEIFHRSRSVVQRLFRRIMASSSDDKRSSAHAGLVATIDVRVFVWSKTPIEENGHSGMECALKAEADEHFFM